MDDPTLVNGCISPAVTRPDGNEVVCAPFDSERDASNKYSL
jgi:hypothetical protein